MPEIRLASFLVIASGQMQNYFNLLFLQRRSGRAKIYDPAHCTCSKIDKIQGIGIRCIHDAFLPEGNTLQRLPIPDVHAQLAELLRKKNDGCTLISVTPPLQT